MNNCSVISNSASFGGGVYTEDGALTMNNCTVARNSAGSGGGIMSDNSLLILRNCTVVGNSGGAGGGINLDTSTLALTNSIVWGNTNVNIHLGSGSVMYALSNLVDSPDPQLAPLTPLNFFVPGLLVMPPLYGSPAINAGSDTLSNLFLLQPWHTVGIDGRGVTRLSGEHVDIGAVEFQSPLFVMNPTDSGEESLRAAVTYNASGSTVHLEFLSTPTVAVSNGPIILNKSFTIIGGYNWLGRELQGNGTSGILKVAAGTTNVLNNLTIGHGNAVGGVGGGIWNLGTLTVNNCSVISNSASFGGGVFTENGALTMNNCTLAYNSAGPGGGILSDNSLLTLNNCTIVGNSGGAGGGINFDTGTLTLTNCIVSGNTATTNANLAIFGTFLGANNLVDALNLNLAPLGYYSVSFPTLPTMPPLPGSPAVDAGVDSVSFAFDQRGYPRLSGDHVDIGSAELQLITSQASSTLTNLARLGDGTLQFGFTNQPGASFRVFATTNLSLPPEQWAMIGFALETPPTSGQFQFTDSQATNYIERYYRVRSP
jgi:hypothetical protein